MFPSRHWHDKLQYASLPTSPTGPSSHETQRQKRVRLCLAPGVLCEQRVHPHQFAVVLPDNTAYGASRLR
jgi:hypothetical protein